MNSNFAFILNPSSVKISLLVYLVASWSETVLFSKHIIGNDGESGTLVNLAFRLGFWARIYIPINRYIIWRIWLLRKRSNHDYLRIIPRTHLSRQFLRIPSTIGTSLGLFITSHGYIHPGTWHSSPVPSNKACSCEIAASSFSHSSNTTMQYTAFLTVFGFFRRKEFLTNEFFGELCPSFAGTENLRTVPGLGKSSPLKSATLPDCGLSEAKLSQESLSERLELVLSLPRLLSVPIPDCGFPEAWSASDCFPKLNLLAKLLGGGPSWKNRARLNNEESVLCLCSSLRVAVGLRDSEFFATFTGCCTSMTTLWMLARLFSSRRIKFFLARWRRRSSPSVWFAIFSTLILTELRIWEDDEKGKN